MKRGVIDHGGQFRCDLNADFLVGGYDFRTEKNGGNAGVLRGLTAEAINVFVFARDDELQAEDRVAPANEVTTGTTAPGQVVCEIVLVRSVAAQGELQVALEEKILVTQRGLAAKNPIVGAGAEREVVSREFRLRARREHQLR